MSDELSCDLDAIGESSPFFEEYALDDDEILSGYGSAYQKVSHYVDHTFRLLGSVALLPFTASLEGLKSLKALTIPCSSDKSREAQLAKAVISSKTSFAETSTAKGYIKDDMFVAFSTSCFQDQLLGTRFSSVKGLEGKCDWDKWIPDHIEGGEEIDFHEVPVNYLENPQPLINILKRMGANAFRLSFERSIIEPTPPCNGEISFNDKTVAMYTSFCRQVKKAIPGIKILGTGTHFVIPQRVEDQGGFVSEKVREEYVQYFLKLMEIFKEVDYWLTFNEPGVKTLQTYRGAYPGNIRSLTDVGRAQMNMVIAHSEICQEAKRKFPNKKVGITHQWLKFQPFSSSNFLERLICHFYNKMFHDPLYQFFKTGKFTFPLPFCDDLQYEAPEDLKYILGIQFYGFPTIKAGFNGGRKYPGNVINWTWGNFGFSFGATCREGEKASSFGPPINPEQLRVVLDEAKQTGHELIVTENGCDAIAQGWDDETFLLDDEGQRAYFETVFNEILPDYREDLLGYCTWTLFRDQLEWDRGVGNTALGIITLPVVDGKKQLEHPIYSPAADFIRDALEEEKMPEELSS